MKRCIDFLVIGAQKAGTTSVFRHLAEHPAIHMPPQKEVNFFAKPDHYARGLDWYLGRHYSAASPGLLWGEASPLYMAVSEAPERIRRIAPRVRLVAVLRDPIERAHSHHRMALRRGAERRDFEHCVRDRLEPPSEGPQPHPESDYVGLGEYARILGGFLERFPRERLWVGFTEELARDPAAFMARIYAFLGVDPGFRAPELGRHFHASGAGRFPAPVRRALKGALKASRPLLGHARSKTLRFWLETELSVRPEPAPPPSPAARALLTRHYREDVSKLEALLGLEVPWAGLR